MPRMPKPTEKTLQRLRRRFDKAKAWDKISARATFGYKVIKEPGKIKPPYRLHPVDKRNGKDLTLYCGSVGFTPKSSSRKKPVAHAPEPKTPDPNRHPVTGELMTPPTTDEVERGTT